MRRFRHLLAGLCAWLVAAGPLAAASLNLPLTGAGGAGGAAAAYTPAGVTFTPEVQLGTTSTPNTRPCSPACPLGVTDSPTYVLSFWMRESVGSTTNKGNESNWTAWLVDVLTGQSDGSCSSEGCPGITFVFDNASGTFGTIRENVVNSTSSAAGINNSFQGQFSNFAAPYNAVWHNYTFIGNMNFAQGLKRNAFYFDGVKQTPTNNGENGTIGAFNVDINSALGWAINGHTNTNPGGFDIANVYLNTHDVSFTGCSEIIDATNTACPALIANIYNAGPVDPGANCAAITGSQPEICLTGDKTTFATNKGTATTALVLANPATGGVATPKLFNASFGPAGAPAGQPVFAWFSSNHGTGFTAATTSMATHNAGNPIVQGDYLLLACDITDTSVAANRAIQTPSGWTLLTGSGDANPYFANSSHPANFAVFGKIADAGDVTASGSDWAAPPSCTWTANANALRGGSWIVADYKNVNAISPVQAAAFSYNAGATNTTPTAPTVTATGIPALLVNLGLFYDDTRAGALQPATSQDARFKKTQVASASIPPIMLSDETLAASGATGTRVGSQSSGGQSYDVSIILQH